jgi:hypothetical protein
MLKTDLSYLEAQFPDLLLSEIAQLFQSADFRTINRIRLARNWGSESPEFQFQDGSTLASYTHLVNCH